ncbi:hypothetical protein GGX14DRAFT_627355 [Mycena pura]|uniref:DUF6533 domain-containing protein n=1 Tax=Mycena pura TaxID=153505 RepID=A0AAD6YR05_9AGAR|nr:hypothetical protein GGX14DRAFT_627355 [Mycena pura]
MSASTPSPTALADALQQIYAGMADTRMTNSAQISSIAFLLYDILLKFDQEYDYIWRSRWSSVKCLYLFARYYGVLYNMQATFRASLVSVAHDIHIPEAFSSVIIATLLEAYSCIKSGSEIAASVFAAPLGLPWPGCFAFPNVKFALVSWIPTAIVATVFFFMTLFSLFQGPWQPSDFKSLKRISPLLVSFVKDGVVFFFFILATLLSNMFMVTLFKNAMASFLDGWLIAVYSYAASRLVLNLREASHLDPQESVTLHSTSRATRSVAFRAGDVYSSSTEVESEDAFELGDRDAERGRGRGHG